MSSRLAEVFGVILVLVVLASPAWGAKLEVVVVSSSGRSAYINQGSAAGVAVGQRVRLMMSGGLSVEGEVVAVTKNSARVDFTPDVSIPRPGTPGRIELPDGVKYQPPAPPAATQPAEDRFETEPPTPTTQPAWTPPDTTQPAATQPAATQPATPEHPPWKRLLPAAEENEPLLSPALSLKPEQRPPKVSGRVYTDVVYGRDGAAGQSNQFVNARAGLALLVTNPFGQGGRIQFEGLADDEYQDVYSGSNNTAHATPQLLSYAQGGEDYRPYRFEVGRFYSLYLPELGLMDGAEGALRLENGLTIGVGAGMYPRPFPNQAEGHDYGFHVFGLYESKEPGLLSTTLGYEKSWHDGTEDRDEILGRFNLHPIEPLWLFGSFRADIYSSADAIKGAGIDLTEAFAQGRYAITSALGVGVSMSHYTFPQIKRDEFDLLPERLIANGRVDRGEVFAWYDITKTLRVGGNVNYWRDQDNHGMGGEADLDWTPAWAGPSLHLALYETDGASATGRGVRIEARKSFESFDTFVGYEVFDFSLPDSSGGDRLRHAARAGVSWQWHAWYYSLTGHYYFGDDTDSLTLGLHAEYRF